MLDLTLLKVLSFDIVLVEEFHKAYLFNFNRQCPPVCKDGIPKILFAWARNADPIYLPEG